MMKFKLTAFLLTLLISMIHQVSNDRNFVDINKSVSVYRNKMSVDISNRLILIL